MVHRFKNNGHNIVLDVESGSVHEVDDIAYDMIGIYEDGDRDDVIKKISELYPETDPAELNEVYDEIRTLSESGELFTEDTYRDRVIDYTKRKTVVKALCLHVAHDCNLSCRYCFAGEGEYHGARGLMSYEVGRAALDFLIANSGDRHNLEVDFFGGEPLLNFDVVKRLVEYGRSREKETGKLFRFTLTTNGVLLNDEVTEYLNKEMHNVVISLDGRKEVHDKMRPYRGGQGSYDSILPNLLRFKDLRGDRQYYVRGTFTRHNLDFANDVLHMAKLGFKELSIEPVVAKETDEYAIREEDLPVLYEEYDRLAHEMDKRIGTDDEFDFFHFMIDLEGGPCVYKRLSGCGSGTEYLAVTPSGELYPCHQFAGMPEFLMGNVNEGITRDDIREGFAGCNVYSREACRDCFAKYYCSGGCAANAYNFTHEIRGCYEVGCALQRKRIECALMLKCAEAADE